MKFKHMRDDFRVPYGTIAITDDGRIGVAICCPKDQFKKALGRQIAAARAEHSCTCNVPRRLVFVGGDYRSMDEVIDYVVERS